MGDQIDESDPEIGLPNPQMAAWVATRPGTSAPSTVGLKLPKKLERKNVSFAAQMLNCRKSNYPGEGNCAAKLPGFTGLNRPHPELQGFYRLICIAEIFPRKLGQNTGQRGIAAPHPERIIGAVGVRLHRMVVRAHH